MAEARSLRDLLIIRDANRDKLEAINGTLGTALGIKHSTDPAAPENGKPCVMVFVPQKIASKWVPAGLEIPRRLDGPNELTCPVDIVEGGKLSDIWLRTVNPNTNADGPAQSWLGLRKTPELSPVNLALREQLRGWGDRLGPGTQIGGTSPKTNQDYLGTLGCLVRERSIGSLGLLTNQHVGQLPNQLLYHPVPGAMPVAVTRKAYDFLGDEKRFAGIIDEPNAWFRVDCAYAEFLSTISRDDLDPTLPVLSDDGESIERRLIGTSVPLDFDTMGLIGTRVIGVGRTFSCQQGVIVAFAYEYVDAEGQARYTDYLIIGDDPNEFSDPGDSGKLILTDEPTPRPAALLWGGWYEKLRSGKDQENWTYAVDINLVLDLLNIDIVSNLGPVAASG